MKWRFLKTVICKNCKIEFLVRGYSVEGRAKRLVVRVRG